LIKKNIECNSSSSFTLVLWSLEMWQKFWTTANITA
jgi:hypothetical protein